MQNKSVNFAVVGCGHIGKRHAEMIVRSQGAKLAALADIKDKQQLGLDNYRVPFFDSLSSLLRQDIDIDIINIATPNGYHASQALQCLEARKHVVIEKPLATAPRDAEKIIFKALQVNRLVFSVMQNRYSPPAEWIKSVINSGILGKIFIVQVNCYWNRDERYYKPGNWHGTIDLDGGTLFTQFSHFIDIMYWLFGDVDNIHSRLACHNHQSLTDFEDSGFVSFDFVNGGMGCLNFSTSVWDKNMESSITIIAENGTIKVGGQYMEKVEYCHIRDYEMPALAPTNPGNDYGSYRGSAANHNYVIENVIDVLQGNGAISTNAMEGLKVVDIISRIYQNRSLQHRKSKVKEKVTEQIAEAEFILS